MCLPGSVASEALLAEGVGTLIWTAHVHSRAQTLEFKEREVKDSCSMCAFL